MLEDLLILLVRLIPSLLVAGLVSTVIFLALTFVGDITRCVELYNFRDTLTGMVFAGIVICIMSGDCVAFKIVLGAYLLWVSISLTLRRLNYLLNANCWKRKCRN